jgi:hypothetical protein
LFGIFLDGTPLVCTGDEPPAVPERVFLVCAPPRWFADMETLRKLALQAETTQASEKEPPPPRLTVDLACMTITLDGVSHDLSSENALRWVEVLADHPGKWISAPELKDYDEELDGCRPDRLKKHLPESVLNLIDSEEGKGSRIRL